MKWDHVCCCAGVVIVVTLMGTLIGVFLTKHTTSDITELKQVHVVLSHGERTPTEKELAMLGTAQERNVTFSPYGIGALTNEGKMMTYDMGRLLKNRYDEFLGSLYWPGDTVMQTSDREITKTSALLILAGLWPPQPIQMWNETMEWQPVPYFYLQEKDDYMLFDINCPRYKQEKQRVLNEAKDDGALHPFKELIHKLSVLTGINITEPSEVLLLKNLIIIQEDLKVPNPKWAKNLKKKIMDLAKFEYHMMFHNELLRKLSGGALLYKMIEDSYAMIESESTTAVEHHSSKDAPAKMYLYSGSTEDVAAMLAVTDVVRPHQPEPGAAFVMELHKQISTGHYGFKIYYWDDDSAEPKLVQMPECDTFCLFKTFVDQTKHVISKDYKTDCQTK